MPQEVRDRINLLESYLDYLDFEGRLWVYNEIWDIKHATNFVRG